MKKQILIILTFLTCSNAMLQADSGGAWVGGTAIGLGTGMLIGSSMNRGDRDPAYYDYKRDREERRAEDQKTRKKKQKYEKDLKDKQLERKRKQREHDRLDEPKHKKARYETSDIGSLKKDLEKEMDKLDADIQALEDKIDDLDI